MLPLPPDLAMDKRAGPLPAEDQERLRQEKLEELESEAERPDELDEAPDVPDTDMM
jgi:hypothetical protein